MLLRLDAPARVGPKGSGFVLPAPIDQEPFSWEVALIGYSISLRAPLPDHQPLAILLSVIGATNYLSHVEGFRPSVGMILSKQSKGRIAAHISDAKYFPLLFSGPLYVSVSPPIPERSYIVLDFRRRQTTV